MQSRNARRIPCLAVLGLLLLSAAVEARFDFVSEGMTWCGNMGTAMVCFGPRCSNCATSACHAGTINAGNGSVTIGQLPPNWRPGQSYNLQVVLEDAGNPSFATGGFELSAHETTSGHFCGFPIAGSLATAAPNTRVILDPFSIQYLMHYNAPLPETGGTAIWNFIWTPPARGAGDVLLNVCAVASDGDVTKEGDSTYCAEFAIPQAGASEDCTDGLDNDANGLTDCEDPSCDGEPCDDGVSCTTGDTCDYLSSVCSGGVDDDLCDDGVFCNGMETCDAILDCLAGSDPCADPGEACDETDDECIETDCGDSADNDGDTLIDCDDADCVGGAETDCSDGIDNDCDTFTDCDDADDCVDPCLTDPNCDCANEDFDGDGIPNAIDCDPRDGSVWAAPIEVSYTDLNPTPAPPPGAGIRKFFEAGPDRYLVAWQNLDQFAGPATTYDIMSGLASDLGQTPEAYENAECLTPSGLSSIAESLINATAESSCTNSIDDDGDGLVDCADQDCEGDAACPETGLCIDRVDNDSDTLVDCDDPDCFFDGNCLPGMNVFELPNIGGGRTVVQYFLIRAQNSCGDGTYGDSPLTPDPRDSLDAGGPISSCF